jgi:hypothetical protein
MGVGNTSMNFWLKEIPLVNSFSQFSYYPFLHNYNVFVREVIRRESCLVDQLTSLTEYPLEVQYAIVWKVIYVYGPTPRVM